nr:hypothetical protein GCM10020063_041200 [Dactylosporangium thailandense]
MGRLGDTCGRVGHTAVLYRARCDPRATVRAGPGASRRHASGSACRVSSATSSIPGTGAALIEWRPAR